MPLLTARLLGSPLLLDRSGVPLCIPSTKAAALLYYMIVNRHVHSRDRLAGMLWPEVPERNAQASLRTALYDLRRCLGECGAALLLVDRTRLGLASDADVESDVSAIEAVARIGEDEAQTEAVLRAAVACYRGPFLEGVHFGDAFDLDDWLSLERERLANLHATALCRLAEVEAGRGELSSAIDLVRRLLLFDPLREDMHRALMRYQALSGQRSAALAQYSVCVDLLQRELGVAPLASTTELFEQIRDDRELAEERPGPGPLARAASRASVPAATLRSRRGGAGPLVGRAADLAELHEEWSLALDAQGGLVTISGEAGVGKSRLVEEFAAELTEDVLVMLGRCHESAVAEPYGPLVGALRGALSSVALEEIGLEPVWRRELARLLPELEDRTTQAGLASLDGVRDRDRLFEGVRAFLAAVAERRPSLLVVEDVHWSDETSLNLVRFVAREPRIPGLLTVVTFRADELSGERRRTVRGLASGGRHIELVTLDERQTADLVAQLAGSETVPERFGRVLHRATGGNPFFLLEMLQALFEQRTLEAGAQGWLTTPSSAADDYTELPIPESVAAIVAARLDRLDDDAHHLLECAAVLRRDFEFDLAAAVSRLPAADALDALDALLAAGLLRELPAEPGRLATGYDFTHALVRDHVYRELSGARRQYLHRQIAGLLEAAVPVQCERVAYHYLRGGVRDRACQWSLRSGQIAVGVYAGESALVHFRSAMEIAVGDDEELAALSGLGDAFMSLGRHAEAVRGYTAALQRAAIIEVRSDLHRRIGRAHERQGAFDKALLSFGEARQLLQGRPLSMTSIRIADSLATVYVRLGRHHEAAELCRDALRWVSEHGDVDPRQEAEAWLCNTLGMALMHEGQFDHALESLDRSLMLKRKLEDRHGEATLRNNLGVVHYHRGDDQAASEHYRASLEIKTAIGDTYGRAIALTNLALIETHLGDFDDAGALLQEAARAADASGAAWLEPEIARVAAQRHLALGDLDAALASASAALLAAETLGVPSFIGVAHRVLGLVKASADSEMSEADEHFTTSLAVFEMLRNDHESAKTHATYGQALLAHGRARDAEAHIRAAAEVFARSGATGRLRRLDSLIED